MCNMHYKNITGNNTETAAASSLEMLTTYYGK